MFGVLAVKAMAFWEISLFSPPKSAVSQTCQNKFNNLIPPSYGPHFGNYNMGIIGVKYTIFMQNAMYIKFINMGTAPATCI